ncbi:MAG: hypothetical protein RLZZ297_1788 [Chloroflexota bacterium]
MAYQLSRDGRRNAWLLLVGAVCIWVFAIWTLQSTLGLSYDPGALSSSLSALWSEGLTVNRTVPALFMLVLMVAAPLTIWNIAMELSSRFSVAENGLRYQSIGIDLTIPWEHISEIRPLDADSDEPSDELLLSTAPTDQIANPLTRFLYAQAYGARVLPIYPGLTERDSLLASIRSKTGLTVTAPAPVSEPTT